MFQIKSKRLRTSTFVCLLASVFLCVRDWFVVFLCRVALSAGVCYDCSVLDTWLCCGPSDGVCRALLFRMFGMHA